MTPTQWTVSTILATTLLALWLMIGSALAQRPQTLIAGIGGQINCSQWLRSESIVEGDAWVLGFWSGLNYANVRTVGQHTDGEGIIAEVRKVCAARPSMVLLNATFTVYSEMANK